MMTYGSARRAAILHARWHSVETFVIRTEVPDVYQWTSAHQLGAGFVIPPKSKVVLHFDKQGKPVLQHTLP